MKKPIFKLLNILLTLAIVLGTMCALTLSVSAADSGTCGDNLTWTYDGEGTLTISGRGRMTGFGNTFETPWDNFRDKITAVKIDKGATTIGYFAFCDCTSLKSVTLPDGLTEIGYYAFCRCTSLTDITIPDSIKNIQLSAFYGCTSLESIKIPNAAIFIQESAFKNTAYYNNPDNWTDNVLYIGNHLIKADTALTGEYNVRADTKSIAERAFMDCALLTSITIPNGVKSIEERTFSGCSSLTNVTIPDSITSIGTLAFYDCSSMTDITLPKGMTDLGSSAFTDCASLTDITVPDGIKEIGWYTFYNCTSLESIKLPDSLSNIEKCAFENTACYNDPDNWTENVLYIGNHLIEADTALTGHYNVRPGTKTIIKHAFSYCTLLTGITIPDSVTTIGDGIFYKCESLKDIEIPDSVTSIGSRTCYNTAYSKNPDNWTGNALYIGNHLIRVSTELDGEYSVREGTKTIAGSSFSDCESLTSIEIPDSVTSIGSGVFRNCTSLTSIEIPNSVKFIENNAFFECDMLTIYGNNGSYAQDYADEHNIPFKAGTIVGNKILKSANRLRPEINGLLTLHSINAMPAEYRAPLLITYSSLYLIKAMNNK